MELDTPFRQTEAPDKGKADGDGHGDEALMEVVKSSSPDLPSDEPEYDDEQLPPGSPLSSVTSLQVRS